MFDKHVGALLTKRKEEKATISAFREALAEVPKILSEPQQLAGQADNAIRPLVFIIDELDRCRPLFALDVIERTKHFFAAPGVHFVLGANLAQLQNSVVVAYGPGIDAHTYLQKFIHLTIMLDRGPDYRSERVTKTFTEFLVNQLQFRPEDARTVKLCVELIERIAEEHELSLRHLERIFSGLAIALAVTDPKTSVRLPPVLAGLCILKVTHPALYRRAKRGSLTFAEVSEIFFKLDGKTEDKRRDLAWEVDWWKYCLDPSLASDKVAEMGREMRPFSADRRFEVVPFTANHEIDLFVPPKPRS